VGKQYNKWNVQASLFCVIFSTADCAQMGIADSVDNGHGSFF